MLRPKLIFSLILFQNISSYIWDSFSFEDLFIYEFSVYGYLVCVYFCKLEGGIGSPVTILIDGCELSYRC